MCEEEEEEEGQIFTLFLATDFIKGQVKTMFG